MIEVGIEVLASGLPHNHLCVHLRRGNQRRADQNRGNMSRHVLEFRAHGFGCFFQHRELRLHAHESSHLRHRGTVGQLEVQHLDTPLVGLLLERSENLGRERLHVADATVILFRHGHTEDALAEVLHGVVEIIDLEQRLVDVLHTEEHVAADQEHQTVLQQESLLSEWDGLLAHVAPLQRVHPGDEKHETGLDDPRRSVLVPPGFAKAQPDAQLAFMDELDALEQSGDSASKRYEETNDKVDHCLFQSCTPYVDEERCMCTTCAAQLICHT